MKTFSKTLLLVITFTLFAQNVKGQHIEISLNHKIQNATYIFEGEVITSESFRDKNLGVIFTSHIVKLSSLFKGNITGDEVEIITVGGSVDGVTSIISNNLTLKTGWEGIFFCRTTQRPSSQFSNSGLSLRVYEGKQGFFRYKKDINSIVATTLFTRYNNIEHELLSVIEQATNKREYINPNKREKELLAWISEKTFANSSPEGSKYGIEYEFVEPRITGSNSNYLEFDIEASTYGGIFNFGNAEIYLDYDPLVFGMNLVASGNIIANKETIILSADYSLSISDETSSKLKLAINSISNPSNPFPLTITGEKLCHIKLDITNLISTSPNIFFDEALMQGNSEFYQNGFFYDFLNVVATDNLSMGWSVLMPPTIDTIYPQFISAGTFDTLYIKGEHFDTTKGDVIFRNADYQTIELDVKADDVDILFWTDILIGVRMFSTNSDFESPGGGSVKVKKAITNDSTTSTSWMSITFAILNKKDAVTKEPILPILIPKNGIDTFKFKLHESTSLTSDTAEVIRMVMKQWRCASGINWKLSDIATNKKYIQDGVNSIYYNTNYLLMDSSTLWVTRRYLSDINALPNICNYNGNKYIYVDEVDMQINGFAQDWFVTTNNNLEDTTKMDFWTTALHEFGHATLLNHVVSPSDVMYPFQDFAYIARTINFYAESGANWIMDSIEIISPHCSNDTLKRNKSGCITSIKQVVSSSQVVNIYPNPFNNQFTIEFDNDNNANSYEILIIDISGRVLVSENGSATYGTNQISISNTSNLTSGFYLVRLRLDNKISFVKVIKM